MDWREKQKHEFLGLGYFIHPLPLGAVFVLALNDHVLKHACPSFVTGKLSDLAGVFFFPLLLCALGNLGLNLFYKIAGRDRFAWLTRRQALVAILLTDVIFVGVKMVPFVTHAYLRVLLMIGVPSRVTRDPTDLVALAMNGLTWWFVCTQAGAYWDSK